MGEQEDGIEVVRPDERTTGPQTPGMDRQQAFATGTFWAGSVRTEGGHVSGWHHHGGYETVIYILDGALRIEYGPEGADAVEAGPGDFVRVPKGVVHRESDPSPEPANVVVVRVGSGQSTFNVDGPHRA